MSFDLLKESKIKKIDLIFIGIIIFGFFIRVWGTNYGMPYDFGHEDEAQVVRNALNYGLEKSLRPIMFNYPAFYSNMLFVFYGLYYLVSLLLGEIKNAYEFAGIYLTKPGIFHFIGRIYSALLGTGTLIVTYYLGKNIFNKQVGMIGAFFLALSIVHVTYSHWALPDVQMVFFFTLALYFCYSIFNKGALKSYIFAGIFSGLSISTKYNAGMIVFAILAAHYLNSINKKLKWNKILFDSKLFILGAFLILSFILGSPYWFLDFKEYYGNFLWLSQCLKTGHIGAMAGIPYLWIFQSLVQIEKGLGILLIAGLIYSVIKREQVDYLILPMIILSVLYIGGFNKKTLYYLLFLFPILSVLSARLIDFILFEKGIVKRYKKNYAYLFSLLPLILIPNFLTILKWDFQLSHKDTRIIAKEWIEKNIPPLSKIAYTIRSFNPPLVDLNRFTKYPLKTGAINNDLQKEYFQNQAVYDMCDLNVQLDSPQFPVNFDNRYKENIFLRSEYAKRWRQIEEMRNDKIEYIILPSFVWSRYFYENPPTDDSPMYFKFITDKRYFEEMMNSNELIKLIRFEPTSKNLGPFISIYKIKGVVKEE